MAAMVAVADGAATMAIRHNRFPIRGSGEAQDRMNDSRVYYVDRDLRRSGKLYSECVI